MTERVSGWDAFHAAARWSIPRNATVDVGEPGPWRRDPIGGLPAMSTLLASAEVTPIVIDGAPRELLTWTMDGARRGWLCDPPFDPAEVDDSGASAVQRNLWTRTGGVRAIFGDVDGWWSPNHGDVLTRDALARDFVDAIEAYSWIWEDDDLTVSIDPAEFRVVAVEANGNLTVVDRDGGRLLLFAPDHAHDGITVLDGCPPSSLYTIDAAPDLTSWIELNARVWLGEG